MWIAGAVVVLFILGLFLEMLSSSPKSRGGSQSDTESELDSTAGANEPLAPTAVH
jgi:hypothetical protein